MTDEQWAWIPGYEGSYAISNLGRVRSLPRTIYRSNGVRYRVRGRVLKPVPHRRGSWPTAVTLSTNGTPQQFLVHRLMAEVWGGNQQFEKEPWKQTG